MKEFYAVLSGNFSKGFEIERVFDSKAEAHKFRDEMILGSNFMKYYEVVETSASKSADMKEGDVGYFFAVSRSDSVLGDPFRLFGPYKDAEIAEEEGNRLFGEIGWTPFDSKHPIVFEKKRKKKEILRVAIHMSERFAGFERESEMKLIRSDKDIERFCEDRANIGVIPVFAPEAQKPHRVQDASALGHWFIFARKSLFDGLEIYGPFKTEEDAFGFDQENRQEDGWHVAIHRVD